MPWFDVPITVHRYVRAGGIDDAQRHVHLGVAMSVEADGPSPVRVRYRGAQVVPYHHAGAGDDLWRVSVRLLATLESPDPAVARETAYGVVTIDGRFDAFEPELVVGVESTELRQAS